MSSLRNLSERVDLQVLQTTEDSSGGHQRNWVSLASVWAQVRPASAVEGDRVGRTTIRRFVKVIIRKRSDVVLPLHVQWRAKNLRVLALRDIGQARMELECEEVVQ